jgi:hypothetical protein
LKNLARIQRYRKSKRRPIEFCEKLHAYERRIDEKFNLDEFNYYWHDLHRKKTTKNKLQFWWWHRYGLS